MTELDGTLADLARVRSGSDPIVTLYLDIRWTDEHRREQARLFVEQEARRMLAHYADGAPGRHELVRTLTRMKDLVKDLTARAYEESRQGLALFAHDSTHLWRPLFFKRPFQDELCADGIPHLLQLARLVDDVVPALVVVPFHEGADLYELVLGDIAFEQSVRGPAPRGEVEKVNASGGKPGKLLEREAREAKEERREDRFVRQNRKLAANEVVRRFDALRRARVVLVGPAEGVAAFERELPERVRAAVVARVPRPREWASADGSRRDGVCGLVQAAIADERREEAKVVGDVVNEALRGGLGVVGPEDVVLAVNEARVHKLVIEEDFARTGWSCDRCGALGAKAESAEVCPFCAGDVRAVLDLGEALVARTIAEGGEVEVIAHRDALHSYRGVGALLRQTAHTGMRGGSPQWPTAPGANQP